MLIELNTLNGAAKFTHELVEKCKQQFEGTIFAVEMGIGYGGGVHDIGLILKDRGIVFGCDTFTGHPIELGLIDPAAIADGGMNSFAVKCMAKWPSILHVGPEHVTYDFIRHELDKDGLFNVNLVKGLITEKTNIDFIPKIHYVLLDMDFVLSMRNGYRLVKDKIVPGGYLCLHDVVPYGHIYGLNEFYQEILKEDLFDVVQEEPKSFLAVLRKK